MDSSSGDIDSRLEMYQKYKNDIMKNIKSHQEELRLKELEKRIAQLERIKREQEAARKKAEEDKKLFEQNRAKGNKGFLSNIESVEVEEF